MLGGYVGKILFVDLTKGEIEEEVVSENIYRDFIGGAGLGIRILYERMKSKADPLGPDNILGFVTGPLTATPTPGSSRFTIVTKSPLTGAWTESNSGGTLGPELKAAGYDAIFFSGISPEPVYLLLSSGKAELRDAAHLWGKSTNETDDILQKELGEAKIKISCIGPAGESCSLISGIVNERGRIAARGGVGAVMGSKKLKALAVRGDKKIAIANPEKLKAVRDEFNSNLKESGFHKGLSAAGTGGGTSFLVSIGDCPTKNWNATGLESMPSCENLNGAKMDKYKIESYGCHACPVRCGAKVKVDEGRFATDSEVRRPEYETLAALGTMCLVDNIEAVIKANEICNLYGIDTMSCGTCIAFAFECYENGLIAMEDTGGMELNWGDAEVLVALAEDIAARKGFGAMLADGVAKAAERIGKGSEKYAMHVRGQGLPYHDPRIDPCRGTSYIADANPGRHVGSETTIILEHGGALGSDPVLTAPKLEKYSDFDKKGQMYMLGAAVSQLLSAAGLCGLLAIDNTVPTAEFIAAVTGWDFEWEEGVKAGRRITTLRQAFNVREGLSPEDFKLPKRVTEPLSVGAAAGVKVDFETLRKGYFKAMGWDEKTGEPHKKTLIYLGLDKLPNIA